MQVTVIGERLKKATLIQVQSLCITIVDYIHCKPAADDKLLMNKFIRQNFGGGLTLKTFIS